MNKQIKEEQEVIKYTHKLAEVVNEQRQKKGYTVEELASELKSSHSTVYRITRPGKSQRQRPPSIGYYIECANILWEDGFFGMMKDYLQEAGKEIPEEKTTPETKGGVTVELNGQEINLLGNKARRWGLSIPSFMKAVSLNSDLDIQTKETSPEVDSEVVEYVDDDK
jgi:transcriptional regulator with XRE-family HTH domain